MKGYSRNELIELKETESTNNFLKELVKEKEIPEFSLVVADFQSKGRGQTNNVWHSEPNENLLFSLLLKPTELPITEQFVISKIVSISMIETLKSYGDDFFIKWPNDIYWKDKKIAGILIECLLLQKIIDSVIVGIGININQSSFPNSLPNPVSLSQIIGAPIDRKEVLDRFITQLKLNYRNFCESKNFDSVDNLYWQHLYRREGFHSFKDAKGLFKARIVNVLRDGILILHRQDFGEQRYSFKEVEFIL